MSTANETQVGGAFPAHTGMNRKEVVAWRVEGRVVIREDVAATLGWTGAFVAAGRAILVAWAPILYAQMPAAPATTEAVSSPPHLPAYQARRLCKSCGWVGVEHELLFGRHPFNYKLTVYGCPWCKEVDEIVSACDGLGCRSEATYGATSMDGYRRTCGRHAVGYYLQKLVTDTSTAAPEAAQEAIVSEQPTYEGLAPERGTGNEKPDTGGRTTDLADMETITTRLAHEIWAMSQGLWPISETVTQIIAALSEFADCVRATEREKLVDPSQVASAIGASHE